MPSSCFKDQLGHNRSTKEGRNKSEQAVFHAAGSFNRARVMFAVCVGRGGGAFNALISRHMLAYMHSFRAMGAGGKIKNSHHSLF